MNLLKLVPRALARFWFFFFPRSVWSHDWWCQLCKLRYQPCMDCCGWHVSYYLSHNRWDLSCTWVQLLLQVDLQLYYTWVQMLLQMGPLFCLGPNAITDGTFMTLGSKCYYRWDLYYTWVQLLHLCLLQRKMRSVAVIYCWFSVSRHSN